MITGIKTWFRRKKLDWAQAHIESYGLSVVKIHEVAGTLYIVKPDGTHMKLVRGKK